MDFKEIFQIELSVWELMLRGTLIYLGILVLMRLMPRRTGGELEILKDYSTHASMAHAWVAW